MILIKVQKIKIYKKKSYYIIRGNANNVNSVVSLPSDMRKLFCIYFDNINYRLPRKQGPGSPPGLLPLSDGLRTCWDSPKPLCTKLAFWLRVPGGRLSRLSVFSAINASSCSMVSKPCSRRKRRDFDISFRLWIFAQRA